MAPTGGNARGAGTRAPAHRSETVQSPKLQTKSQRVQRISPKAATHIARSQRGTERKTGFEPATPSLARTCATAAPLPQDDRLRPTTSIRALTPRLLARRRPMDHVVRHGADRRRRRCALEQLTDLT